MAVIGELDSLGDSWLTITVLDYITFRPVAVISELDSLGDSWLTITPLNNILTSLYLYKNFILH